MQLSELFYSLQGEGTTRGVPAVFIRFPGCNLTCGIDSKVCDASKASWICDSYSVWTKKTLSLTNEELLKKLSTFGSCEDYSEGRIHLVWTGGEPLLENNASQILSFLSFALEQGYLFYSEVETNGTQFPDPLMKSNLIHLVNCSPKLSSSGVYKDIRCQETVISNLLKMNTYFKFVITASEQWSEIENDFSIIPLNRIILMPGMDHIGDDTQEVAQEIWQLAQDKKVKFSTREHIHVWNKLTGV